MKFTGRNVYISPTAVIGQNVRIGDNTSIYDAVEIGDNTVIANDCVIGEPTAAYYRDAMYQNRITMIGSDSIIRSHTIVYAGATAGHHFETGHHAVIREESRIGNHCRIGTFSDLQGNLKIGDHCHLHSSVHLCQGSELGDFVFVYPFVVLTNDKHPPSTETAAPKIGSYTQIGVHAVVIGGISVGEHCLIGANATVTQTFEDHSFILGSPAERKMDVRELKDNTGQQLYPWPQRFSRRMPWGENGSELK